MDFHRSSKHVSSFRVLLKTLQRYPGDMLRGVVEITVNAPLKYTLLEAHLRGEEVTRFGTAFTKRIDTESRYTTYYRQRVILAGLLPPSDEQRGSEKSSSGHWSDAGVSVTDSAEIGPNIVTMGLMPGTYTFPFSVRLPETLPPSYSDHHGSGYSKLLYSIKAKLYSGSRSLVKDRVYFVVCMLPVNPRQWVTVHKSLESGTIASIAGGSREGSALQDTLEMQGMGDRQAEQEDRDMLYREESEYLAGGNFLLIEHRIPLYNANVNVDGINANNGLDVADDDTTPLDHAVDLVKLSRRQRKEKEHEEKERRRMEKRKKKEQEKMRKRKQEQGMKEAGGGGEEEAPEVGDKSKKGQEKKLSEPSGNSWVAHESEECHTNSLSLKEDTERNNSAVGNGAKVNGHGGNGNGTPAANSEASLPLPDPVADIASSYDAALQGMPLWEQSLEVPICGVFKKGTVSISLTLQSIICMRGTPISFRAVIDNTNGLASITKIVFTLVTAVEMSSRVESHKFKIPLHEYVVHNTVSRECKLGIPVTHIIVPKNAPVTLFTAGYSCRTFLQVKVSGVHTLKTYSGSAMTEILVVDRFDTVGNTRRGRSWTNFYRGREIGRNSECPFPDVICPFVTSGDMRIAKEDSSGTKDSAELSSPSSSSSEVSPPFTPMGSDGTASPLPPCLQERPLDLEHVVYYPRPLPNNCTHSRNPLQRKSWSERMDADQ